MAASRHVRPIIARVPFSRCVATLVFAGLGCLFQAANASADPMTPLWSGGADAVWLNPANWQGGVQPVAGDTVFFGSTAQTSPILFYDFAIPNVPVSEKSYAGLHFNADAPAYTLRLNETTKTTLTGAGVVNESPNVQLIDLYHSGPYSVGTLSAYAAELYFHNSAIAGDTTIQYRLRGGYAIYLDESLEGIFRYPPATIEFHQTATAGAASFQLDGGSGNGVFGGFVRFFDNSSAGNAQFTVEHGVSGLGLPKVSVGYGFGAEVLFMGSSSASGATLHNIGGAGGPSGPGLTTFGDNSSAGHASIVNFGATDPSAISGLTLFDGFSNAGQAVILNQSSESAESGATRFFGSATAGQAMITNQGPTASFHKGGRTVFNGTSTAGQATLISEGAAPGIAGNLGGLTSFEDNSSADQATILVKPGVGAAGAVQFLDQASGGAATIQVQTSAGGTGGLVIFYDQSTAGNAVITVATQSLSGTVAFHDDASATGSTIILANNSQGYVEFFDHSSAGGALISVGSQSYLNFRDASSAGLAQIELVSGSYGQFTGWFSPDGSPTTTAGNAAITLRQGGIGGSLAFNNNSTAGNAMIINEGGTQPGTKGGDLSFNAGSHAGNATITTRGGTNGGLYAYTRFSGGATGDNAKLITTAGGVVDFSGNRFFGGTSVGMIEGAGIYVLDHSALTVGSLNLDMTVDGTIVDNNPQGGAGGTLTKVGTGTLRLNGVNTYLGLTTVANGRLLVNGSIAGGALVQSGGILGGSGTIVGVVTVEVGGIFSPGSSPGAFTIGGLRLMDASAPLAGTEWSGDSLGLHDERSANAQQQSDSVLEIEIGGRTQGAEYDFLDITGDFDLLGGSLGVSLVGPFKLGVGEWFNIVSVGGQRTGTFAGLSEGALVGNFGGTGLFITYAGGDGNDIALFTSGAALIPGDADGDGDVDGDDFNAWGGNYPTASGATLAQGDFDGDGDVDGDDFNVWGGNYPYPAPAPGNGAGAVVGTPVPEPATVVLVGLAGLVLVGRRRAARRR